MLVKSSAVALLAAASASAAAVSVRLEYAAEKAVKEDADFGLCIPTMKYEGGLGARSAVDFAFLPTDPLCARGQQETANPNIITNRICDQLSTMCGANEAAQALCRDAQTKIRTLGTRNKSTADTWNTLLGFGGALSNPDGGAAQPQAVKDLKKRELNEKRAVNFIACSATEWIDTCTGWPDAAPVTKRDVEAASKPVVKRSAEPEPAPAPEKRSDKSKRAVPFIACSATEWIDTCTGWE